MKTWVTKSGCRITRILSGRSNVFLVSNQGRNILVDTSPAGKWEKLKRNLKVLDIDKLDLLILTHAHFDHAANANRIKKLFHTAVVINAEEEDNMRAGINTLPCGTNIFTRTLISVIGNKISGKFDFEPCEPDIIAGSGFSLEDYGFNAYLVHTPGHSPGSSSLIVDDEITLAGDTIFGVFCWSAYPPFADDTQALVNSWGKLLETGCRLFLPSHGSSKTREKLSREYKQRINK